MTRKLQPCGTRAAYVRHLYNNQDPCDACKAANVQHAANSPSGTNRYEYEATVALNANPPVITWRRKNNGVWVATSVHDPHAETGAQRAWEERMAREEAALAAMEEQAREVAARFEQHRADNTPLMTSARREI